MDEAAQSPYDDDMFAAMPSAPPSAPQAVSDTAAHLEFEGQLVRNADVRSKPARDGLHSVPVVVMELRSLVGNRKRTCHAEYPFTDGTRREAEALAKSLTKGLIVTVSTPVAEMRLSFPHVDSISIHPEQKAA